MEHKQWSGKTGGQVWMQKSLVYLCHYLSLHILYLVVACVVPFYMLFSHKGYISIYHFFRKRIGYSPIKSFWNVFLNHLMFGKVIIDRFATYAGKKFDIEIEGKDYCNYLYSQEKGFVLLSSHIGNFELAGYFIGCNKKRFNSLVFEGETEIVKKNRNKMLLENNIHLIPVKDDMSHIFLINDALGNNEVVGMPADRIFGSQKYVECEFLSKKAKFPIGAFALAVSKEVPIVSIFVMKESFKKYKIYVKQVIADNTINNKKEKIETLVNNFAKQLEDIVLKYPTQWFNYYEFWE